LLKALQISGVKEVIGVFKITYTSAQHSTIELSLTCVDIRDDQRCEDVVSESLHRLEWKNDCLDCSWRQRSFGIDLLGTCISTHCRVWAYQCLTIRESIRYLSLPTEPRVISLRLR
jgi:hypothetical protein